jgi:hypothetical protein
MEEANRQFRQLVSGAPAEVLAALGEGLLALHRQRGGEAVDSAAALRQGLLELARWLVRTRSGSLNPQQQLFLSSGALADSVTVKDPQGQPVTLELLPAELYARLLAAAAAEAAPEELSTARLSLLYPVRRWRWLAAGELAPFDMAHPGRFKPYAPGTPRLEPSPRSAAAPAASRPAAPEARAAGGPDAARLGAALAEQGELAQQELRELSRGVRQLAETMRGDRLAAVLKELTQFSQFAQAAAEQLADPARAGQVELPTDAERHPALMVVKELQVELAGVCDALLAAQRKLLDGLARQQQLARLVAAAAAQGSPAAPATAPEAAAPLAVAGYPPDQLRKLEADQTAVAQMMTQCLINHPQRTPWSSARVLLQEQLDKLGAPPEDCLATPPALLASLARVQGLHPNCFPLDPSGAPVLPPVVVEPGVGVVRWLDDRFLLSFVAADAPRKGPQLSLTPLDQAVLRLYGGFLARGDIFNYRGERLADNFMAEYAGEIEQRVAVKFTGAEKKLTYGTAAEEKDGANREDAVKDYIDFVFSVFNGLPLPKRISPRKASVLLRYCLFGDVRFTVGLALNLLAAEPLLARQAILAHTRHNTALAVQLVQQALEESPLLQTRYRRDLAACLLAVFGHEFVDDARAAGLLGGPATRPVDPGTAAAAADGAAPPEAAASRDYFDL